MRSAAAIGLCEEYEVRKTRKQREKGSVKLLEITNL